MDTTLDPQQQPPFGQARQGAPPARARWQRGTWPVRANNPRVVIETINPDLPLKPYNYFYII